MPLSLALSLLRYARLGRLLELSLYFIATQTPFGLGYREPIRVAGQYLRLLRRYAPSRLGTWKDPPIRRIPISRGEPLLLG